MYGRNTRTLGPAAVAEALAHREARAGALTLVDGFSSPLLVLLVGLAVLIRQVKGEGRIESSSVFGCIIYQHLFIAAASAFIPDSSRRSSLLSCSAPASHRPLLRHVRRFHDPFRIGPSGRDAAIFIEYAE